MGRKSEFKPDKPYSGWFARHMPTRLQQKHALKWLVYTLVLLALSVAQDVLFCHVRVLGAAPDLVPCAIFLFTILEGTEKGCVFALLTSLLYVFSGMSPGIFVIIVLTGVAIFGSMFRQAYLQKGFGSAMLCVAGCLLLYELTVFLAGMALGLTYWGRIGGFLITAALSFAAAPVLYPIGLSIGAIGGNLWNE